MEMMDINEALMELEFDFDPPAYKNALLQLETIEGSMAAEISEIVKSYEGTNETEEALNKIKDYYLKKRYLLRIRENLDKFATL